MKEKNVIQKFREFWGDLGDQEAVDLWSFVTALRGPDNEVNDSYELKLLTTAHIRHGIFGTKLGNILGARVYVRNTQLSSSGVKKMKRLMKEASQHFSRHYQDAIDILRVLCPGWKP